MSKTAIITSIYNNYDTLKNPIFNIPDSDLICITDRYPTHPVDHRIIIEPQRFDDPQRFAKLPKILPHRFFQQYSYTLWIDASVLPLFDDINFLIDKYLKTADLALFKHPWRNSIKEEADECIKLGLDSPEKIQRQVKKYQNEGYPDSSLYAGTIILRRMSTQTTKFNEIWWKEIKRHSKRDQLSLPYAIWKANIKVNILGLSHIDNTYFKLFDHLHKLNEGPSDMSQNTTITRSEETTSVHQENRELKSQIETLNQTVDIQKKKFDSLRSRKIFRIYRYLYRKLKGKDPIFEEETI